MSPNISMKNREEEILAKHDLRRKDLRQTSLWHQVTEFYKDIHAPSFDQVSAAADLVYSAKLKTITFTGSFWLSSSDGELSGQPTQRICLLNLDSGKIQIITGGPNSDTSPQWSPDGSKLLFLSDRRKHGIYQAYVFKREEFAVPELLVKIECNVEYARWSPDGMKVLLGTVGLGPEDTQAATDPSRKEENRWMPSIEADFEDNQWRKLWVYDTQHHTLTATGTGNPWEAVWAGNEEILKISSSGPGEEAWYHADIMTISQAGNALEKKVQSYNCDGKIRQFGALAASQDGNTFAFVRSLASDRPFTAGDVYVANSRRKYDIRKVDVGNVDVTCLEFFNERTLFYAGICGIGLVVGRIRLQMEQGIVTSGGYEELFRSSQTTADGWLPRITVIDESTFGCALQSRQSPPRIGIVRNGEFKELHSFAHEGTKWLQSQVGDSSIVKWKSKDGLEIEGLLDLPRGVSKPYPLILHVHGGPTSSWQNTWDQWSRFHFLVAKGYAILSTNPRGSTGRGQSFAEKVLGDVGGMETHDHLSGIDHLIKEGIADPDRIGVIGGSHGGFMATWIITQDSRFKACVPVAAVTDWHSFHYTTNIRNFDPLYVDEDPYKVSRESRYLQRSPIIMASKTKTPTLQIAGDIDFCVDKSQGKEFHNALLENGVPSVLAIYPGEGHGVRKFPAIYDTTVRTLGWFQQWMPSDKS